MELYNSLTKTKETFKPIDPNQIKLYVCGVTVYDYCHIGHARTYLAFDVLVRYLRQNHQPVKYVRNITDIDDKIIRRAHERKVSCDAIVDEFIQAMHQDFDALGMLRPDVEPRATETIQPIIDLIQTLIDKNHAYVGSNQDVYFRVADYADYGQLSGQNIEDLQAGQRVDVNEHKENPLDFVLWKQAKPGEPEWPSPWGMGRPGWHIECSAMTLQELGSHFDLHGGGSDLKFPHHENEMAQSCAATNDVFANCWMHTGMVQVNAEKMSKSLGNFFIIRDVLKQYPSEVVRYFLISGHYRSEINYSEDNLNLAAQALNRLYCSLRGPIATEAPAESSYAQDFHKAMQDDLNTPKALAVLFDLARKINTLSQDNQPQQVMMHRKILKDLAAPLGILQQEPNHFLQGHSTLSPQAIEQLINERNIARAQKNFARADEIRQQLNEAQIIIEDSESGTTWRQG